MRTASSYRGAKRRAAREAKVPFAQYNEHYERSRHYAAAEMERAEARKQLALWAASGGRETSVSPAVSNAELDAMNASKLQDIPERETAEKIKIEDIDKALENTLTKWQAEGHTDPLPLSKLFAARARQLGWIEGVEFAEDKTCE